MLIDAVGETLGTASQLERLRFEFVDFKVAKPIRSRFNELLFNTKLDSSFLDWTRN